MHVLIGIASVVFILVILTDVFHTIVLARRTRRAFRVTRMFYRVTWRPYSALARRIVKGNLREDVLGVYGPLSLLVLFAVWAVALIVGFAFLQWAVGFRSPHGILSVSGDMYVSSTALLTLETGEPQNAWSKFITSCEGAIGFTLLGLVIAYLPVFYGAFSEREKHISLLDARAGSPPSALALLNLSVSNPDRVERFLERFEQWSAELLANELSFPMIAFFRSNHANQSWLTALTVLTDATAVISLCSEGDLKTQAELTFAMGRHALADIAAVFRVRPKSSHERLSDGDLSKIHRILAQHSGGIFNPSRFKGEDLRDLARMYEPQAQALSAYLLMALPPWTQSSAQSKDWIEAPSHLDGPTQAISDPFRKN